MSNEQSNTEEGAISVIANEALTDKEGLLAVLAEDTNVLEAKLPDTAIKLGLGLELERRAGSWKDRTGRAADARASMVLGHSL